MKKRVSVSAALLLGVLLLSGCGNIEDMLMRQPPAKSSSTQVAKKEEKKEVVDFVAATPTPLPIATPTPILPIKKEHSKMEQTPSVKKQNQPKREQAQTGKETSGGEFKIYNSSFDVFTEDDLAAKEEIYTENTLPEEEFYIEDPFPEADTWSEEEEWDTVMQTE